MYYDEYGRLRMNEHRNPRVVATTFAEWQNRINPQTSAAPTSAAPTSASPTSGGTTDESQGAAAGGGSDGGDVRDNEIHNMSLPEYDNIRDWVDAVSTTPNIMGPTIVADAIVGRGVFDPTQDRSYTTRSGELMNAGQPSYADLRSDSYAGGVEKDSGAQPGGTGPNSVGEANAEARGKDNNDITGSDYAEGGPVFNSSEQVPGPVVGPGGPKDDSIDANLSNGEFVNTAEATQTFGQDFLTQLNDIARAPEAQGLTANPEFEQSKQEFIKKISGMMAPPPGMAPQQPGMAPQQPGMMAPAQPPMTPPQNPAQPGFAEGGAVSVSPSKGGSLMAPDSDFFDWLMDKYHSMSGKAKKIADTSMNNTDSMRIVNPTKPEQDEMQSMAARSGKPPENPLKGYMAKPAIDQYEGVWTPSTDAELDKARKMDLEDGKFSKSTPAEMDKAKRMDLEDGKVTRSTQAERDKARRMDLEDGKWSKATPSELDKARKGMSGLKDAKNAPPKGPGLMADPAAKVAGPTTMSDDEMVNAVSKKVLMGLMTRMIPGVGGVAAGMMPGDTNEGEAEGLAKALKDPQAAMGNVKESRNKDDKVGMMAPSSDPEFEEEKALFETSKKVNAPKKPPLKIDINPKSKTKAMDKSSTKKTSSEGNKLAPGASLGDALAFYKSKGASTFEWDGDTYVKSNSNSGYSVKN